MRTASRIRVLHALGGLDRGGIETWLMHVLRHIDRDRFHMDFLVHSVEPGAFDDEVRALGSNVISCLPTGLRRPWSYLTYPRRLLSLLRKHGPYEIIHGHMQEFSAYFLRAGEKAGMKVRIAHSHNGMPPAERQPGTVRRAYRRMLSRLVKRHATHGLACSRVAARSLYGDCWESDGRWDILHYGIDPSPFSERSAVQNQRNRLGIPKGARVVGHVGRFVEQKNHAFLLEVIAECIKQEPGICFLLVGDGPLRPGIQAAVEDRGLAGNVIFTGVRSDVPCLMLSAMDLFVLPSLWEGLGMVLIEAQAAGLPVVASNYVPDEACVVSGQFERLELADGPRCWAEHIVRRLGRQAPDGQEAFEAVMHSSFTLGRSACALQGFYEGTLQQE